MLCSNDSGRLAVLFYVQVHFKNWGQSVTLSRDAVVRGSGSWSYQILAWKLTVDERFLRCGQTFTDICCLERVPAEPSLNPAVQNYFVVHAEISRGNESSGRDVWLPDAHAVWIHRSNLRLPLRSAERARPAACCLVRRLLETILVNILQCGLFSYWMDVIVCCCFIALLS